MNHSCNLDNIINTFTKHRNLENKIKQEKYLKNQFEFLGIPQPLRKEIQKQIVSDSKKLTIDQIIDLVIDLHKLNIREYMYLGQNILTANIKKLNYDNVLKLVPLIRINSWWENIDGYVGIFNIVLLREDKIEDFIDKFYQDEDFWIRRMTILIQLKSKEKVNIAYLEKVIEYNYKDNEFFIQKAIGWMLREYSKNNPEYVIKYIENNNFSNFIQKEALKVINKKSV